MTFKSARHVVMDTLVDSAKRVRGGAYFVKRGVIVWPEFDFAEHPRAIAVQCDRMPLLPSGGGPGDLPEGFRSATISLEVEARIPEQGSPPGIDDGLLDEMTEDVETILRELEAARAKYQGGGEDYPVVFRIDARSAAFHENHDVDLRVQGGVASFSIDF